jgi:hypothetical protein
VWSTTPTKQSSGKTSCQCLWGKRNRYARAQGNLDANKQERMMRANFIPALCWDWPNHARQTEGGGSFGNGLLHSRPLPRRRMNQGPQEFPTLLHCPDSCQHHNPPDCLTDRRRWINQPPARAAPECGQPKQSHTPRKHAAAAVRNPHGHLGPQHHKGMGLSNSVGMHQPPSRH